MSKHRYFVPYQFSSFNICKYFLVIPTTHYISAINISLSMWKIYTKFPRFPWETIWTITLFWLDFKIKSHPLFNFFEKCCIFVDSKKLGKHLTKASTKHLMESTRCAEVLDIIFSALFTLDFDNTSVNGWIINTSVNRCMHGGVKHITTQSINTD